ncbi:OmpA family protein [Marimonas lutisalis]|uniref:OmpA family protein n=1 Tax=Marimonas lutisalis TaxID=2545756 RepID=UPI0010F8A187|nr:OmpA family protein [Marimonas lutisalis]
MTNTTRNRADPRTWLGAVLLALIAAAGAPAAHALDFTLPSNARLTAERITGPDSYNLPTGAADGSAPPTRQVEGQVSRRAWRIDAQGITTLQLLDPLRTQLADAGYEIIFECEAATCGGFDFRFGIEVFPAPDMHVDLYDYRFLSARLQADGGASSFATIIVSRTASAGFVQIVQITAKGATAPKPTTSGQATTAPAADWQTNANLPLAQALETRGHIVLSDLDFKTGSSDLGDGQYDSLARLAAYLLADSNRRIALVGHTDAVGTLENNIALSKRRAASVLERLATAYGVPRNQMTAEGMGYLAPLTTNLTPEGREMNRRVEAILLNTE